MLRLRAEAHGIFARAHEIAQRFVVGRRDVDRGEFAGTMQPRQGVAIVPVGLDPIAAPFRHARRIDDDALLALGRQVPMNPKSAGTRLIHEAQPSIRGAECLHHLRQRLELTRNPAVPAHLAVSPLFGQRDVDRFLVDIHPHEHATFRHDLPPLDVALRGTLIGIA